MLKVRLGGKGLEHLTKFIKILHKNHAISQTFSSNLHSPIDLNNFAFNNPITKVVNDFIV